jgi:F420-dependent oxidoreductase-like protein
MGRMRIGLQVPSFTWPGAPGSIGPTLRHVAVRAEEAGLSSFWVMDHFFQISVVGAVEEPMLEGWTALAHVAAVTDRITLGTMVTGVTYRHPGVLVKTATTLDVLSGGRAWLGIGAAWNEEEHRGLGVPYPPLAERFERLEETLRIAHQMWRGDESPFHGTHYQLERPLNSPPAVSTPHPRVLIGGTGEKKTLRFVAQYADACNIFEMPVPAIRAKLDVLQGHCADVGRDYAQIEKTTLGGLRLSRDGAEGTQTVDQALDRFGRLAAIGVDQAIVNMPAVHDPASWELVPELVEKVGALVPAGR